MESLPAPRRRFGQNFLVDERIVGWIVEAIGAVPGRAVVEIGPGRGALTVPLAASGADLVAVELDRDLAARLARQFAGAPSTRIVEADALALDWPSRLAEWFPGRRPVVAGNLPYNVATPIVRALLAAAPAWTRLVLMFQREVAERLVATEGGDYGYLSLERAFAAKVVDRHEVWPGAFVPQPKVASTLLVMEPLADPPDPARRDRALALASAGFAHRRKVLAPSLAKGSGRSRDEVVRQLGLLGHPADVRPERVPPEHWLALADGTPA